MTDVIMVGDRTQALTLLHHSYRLPLLVRGELWLGPEFDASLCLTSALYPLMPSAAVSALARRSGAS